MLSFNTLLVRYGELTLKSKGIRALYETTLVNQIKYLLDSYKVSYQKMKKEQGRLFIYFLENKENNEHNLNKSIKVISNIFGVYSISPCISCNFEINELFNLCSKIGSYDILENETYGVKVKKACNYKYTSQELAMMCGDKIWKSLEEKNYKPKVNLTNPDKLITIELREKEFYIFFKRIKCLGGLPVGTQGKMIVLFSGGIDSPVAAWLMMKRGVEVIPVFIDNGKYGSKKIIEKVKENAIRLFYYSPKKTHFLYHIFNEKYMDLIIKNCSIKYRCIMCKRSMYIIANKIRQILNADGIITGSSLGQVASQTSKNMAAECYNLSFPIYHPLIGFDKQEIVDLAKKIGTYLISIKQIDDVECKAVPIKPEINGTGKIVIDEENKIDSSMLKEINKQILCS